MPPDGASLHDQAIAWLLIFTTVVALAMTLINLRNADSWLLRIGGRRAGGVVANIQIVTTPTGEVLRRPTIEFTTQDGSRVVSTPAVFRNTVRLAKGSPVRVSYWRRKPSRIVVHGYDFRLREPIYAALGVAIAIGIATSYFNFEF